MDPNNQFADCLASALRDTKNNVSPVGSGGGCESYKWSGNGTIKLTPAAYGVY